MTDSQPQMLRYKPYSGSIFVNITPKPTMNEENAGHTLLLLPPPPPPLLLLLLNTDSAPVFALHVADEFLF